MRLTLLIDHDLFGNPIAAQRGQAEVYARYAEMAKALECELNYSALHTKRVKLSSAPQQAKPLPCDDAPTLALALDWPLITQADLQALLTLYKEESGDQAAGNASKCYACAVEQRHHPITSFRAAGGKMDFSHSLNSPNWRELEEQRFLQLHAGMGLCPSKKVGKLDPAAPFDALALLDERAGLRSSHPASRFLIERIQSDPTLFLPEPEALKWLSPKR